MAEKNYISTSVLKRNHVKLPHELANHPHIKDASVTINSELITFILPAADPEASFADVWQYVHEKKVWAVVTFG